MTEASFKRTPIIQCDKELMIKLSAHLQFATVGKKVYITDNLKDLVERHCPDIYQIAEDAGYKFLPSTNAADLEQVPPDFRFDVIKISA